MFCSITSFTCQNQLSAGATCNNDWECRNGMGCDRGYYPTDTGTCVLYYTKVTGDEVQLCVGGTVEAENNLCMSGICVPTSPGSNLTTGNCAPALKSSWPKTCQEDSDCGAGSFESGVCTCGRNAAGLAYCQPYSGDAPKATFRNIMMSHLTSPNLGLCQTMRRFTWECVQIAGSNAIGTFLSAKYWAQNAPALINNDDCVKAIFSNHAYFYEEFCPAYGCSSSESGSDCATYSEYENMVDLRRCKSG